MSSAQVTLTSRHASCGTVDFYIGAICSKADNIKNLCNNHNRDCNIEIVILAVAAMCCIAFIASCRNTL